MSLPPDSMARPVGTPGRLLPALEALAGLGLKAGALGLMLLLALKALFDVDENFDAWWYHLPWAARLGGLVPPEAFQFEPIAAHRFEGFPLLPEWLQGQLWRLTGRVESANLVNYGALVVFVIFLRRCFQVPWWLTVPALLAVPLVQAQASVVYVDLLANLALAALVLLGYRAWSAPAATGPGAVALMVLCALIAAHSKFQLFPLVGVALALSLWPVLFSREAPTAALARRHRSPTVALLLVVLAGVFFVPLKNTLRHGNPVYPLQLHAAGLHLKGPEALPPGELGGGPLATAPGVVKWLYSVGEIGMGPVLNVKRWRVDSSAPAGAPMGIQGGLFHYYVAANLALLLWLLPRLGGRERRSALIALGLSVTLAALMPAAHLLRYYMFWFICLIAINLHWLATRGSPRLQRLAGLGAFAAVLVVIDATDQNFIRPAFTGVDSLLEARVKPEVLQRLARAPSACLALQRANEPFLYASIWHPGTAHAIQAGPFSPALPEEVAAACAGRDTIITGP